MGGSSYNTSSPQTMQDVLNAYTNYLPGLMDITAGKAPMAALGQVDAANQLVNPGQHQTLGMNALNLDQLYKYALPEAKVGQDVAESNALAGANTNLKQLLGPGAQVATAARNINEATNPEYYKAAQAASNGAAQAVNAINLNGLSPGEQSAVERSLNQTNTTTGNMGLVNPTNVVSNAMNFGGAFNNKINLMNNAVASASGAANATAGNGGFNGVNVALGQPNASTGSNFGSGQFTNSNAQSSSGAAGNAFSFGSGLLGNMAGMNNTAINAGASMTNATSPASYLGAVCCFIFLEAYNGKLPKCVRKGRDKYYAVNPEIASGYRRMAKWLVPLMQCNPFIRWLVWTIMVSPITIHLSKPKKGINKTITHTWLRVWAIMGKNHWDSEYAELMYPAYV